MNSFKCPNCGNSNPRYIGIRNNNFYCRKCITFRGQEVIPEHVQNNNAEYSLNYELSNDQKRLSKILVNNYTNGVDTLVHAVCGSGKTEIVLEVIKYAINKNQRVGFCVPRRDVIRELSQRFKSIFTNNSICVVHGGNTKILEADLVCLTTHQLFRYKNYFDLLILDEVDAFPYQGNDVLESMFHKAVRGHYIWMSATPSKQVIQSFKKKGKDIVNLDTRFHKHPLPVPRLSIHHGIMKYYHLVQELRAFSMQNKPVFIFTPTIEMCEKVYSTLRFLFKDVRYVHSKCENRNEIIQSFRNGDFKLLVTTAVLERGVTVKDLQVIVFNADHKLYTSAALIQIAGRVGRKKECPTGEVIFIGSKKTDEMEQSIEEIKRANQSLQSVF